MTIIDVPQSSLDLLKSLDGDHTPWPVPEALAKPLAIFITAALASIPLAAEDRGCEVPTLVSTGGAAPRNPHTLAIRWTGYPYAAYYAAKAAVNSFTMGLALQYAEQGIRVNAVMPGLMNTPLIHQQISGQYQNADEMVKARDAACPMGRMGTAWDVARAALFLASDDAAYITGVCLPVDGGLSCRAA